jgi:hypothetical protein
MVPSLISLATEVAVTHCSTTSVPLPVRGCEPRPWVSISPLGWRLQERAPATATSQTVAFRLLMMLFMTATPPP